MRRLLESLMPDERQIYWRWVAGMFALYVVLMGTAATLFVNHEPARKLAREPASDCGNRPLHYPGLDHPAAGRARLRLAVGVQTPIALRATTSR